jgi:hypothetical protein
MLAQNLTLDDADGTDTIFNLTSQDANGNRRVDTSTTRSNLRVLNIRHTQSGTPAKGNVIDRHLVQIVQTVPSATGPSVDITVNFTMNVPRVSDVTNQQVLDNVALILDLLTDGALVNPMTSVTMTALLRGES